MRHASRPVTAVLAAAVLVVGAALALFDGLPRVVITSGSSMQPTLVAGDLVVLRRGAACTPGVVTAYPTGPTVVLHRVVGAEGDRCVFKGDNNGWTDPARPRPSDLLGTLVLRVPGGGAWWHRVTSPTLLGVVAFALIGLTGTPPVVRRSRRGRRQTASGRPLARPRPLSLR